MLSVATIWLYHKLLVMNPSKNFRIASLTPALDMDLIMKQRRNQSKSVEYELFCGCEDNLVFPSLLRIDIIRHNLDA